MRVGFDITPHNANRMTGAGRVVAGYARTFSSMADGPELVLIGFRENFHGLEDLDPARVDRRIIRRASTLGPAAGEVGRWRGVRSLSTRRGFEIFHANLEMVVPAKRIPVVYHLYDLVRMDPEAKRRDRSLRAKVRTQLRYGLADRADAIVTISRASREDISRRLGIDPDRIRVIHPGIEDRFFDVRPAQVDLVLRRYGLDAGYALFVGQLGRQKNESLLLSAWEKVSGELGAARVVIAGDSSTAEPGFGLKAKRVDAKLLGRVADEDLPALISGAGALILTSTNEGFGLPVAEALAAGTPVIVGDRGALPEVAGDAGVIVPADDADSLSRALLEVLSDHARSRELREKARARGRMFRWDRAAGQMLDLYSEVVSRKRSGK